MLRSSSNRYSYNGSELQTEGTLMLKAFANNDNAMCNS